ncbi:carbohydrate ABC transporter substrate-binding protein, CUT1 family [Nakamurella panacisegetis]|uniref:Carbohydrate ABC transporter substrate-binding protein, CUT1 family n=1 Tax=Nakamurella panacisegetis TaxID=1090615 RepID=A0A1H0IXT8_9ACTN|nr:extracellular solute-binding protein [Nakamurella panacisegetis]SDO36297.1 carbohydrate ABC transporter substrate-binding protein, CUT1 family [Nakamurella panacisegetis]
MKIRRLRQAIALALAASAVLAGCSSSTAATGDGANTLNFVNDKSWDFKAFSQVSEKDIKVSLNSSTYADQPAFQAFVKQSFRTNKSPGLFTWHTGDQLKLLVDQNLVADTSSIWAQAIADNQIAPGVKDLYTINGKQYCTPISVDDWVMYYDKKTFAKYSLTPPTTWAEMMADAAVLKKNGIAPFWSSGGDPWAFVWFQILLAGTDLQLYKDLSTGKASYTDPKVVSIMNTWLDMEKKGYFSDPGSKTAPETQMKDGKLAMIPFGTWYASTIDQVGLKAGTDWGVFTIPKVNAAQAKTPVAIETAPACVAANSPQKDLGLKYSAWWMTSEAQTAWSKQQNNLPYNPKATAATQTFVDVGKELSNNDKYETYLRYYEATPQVILTEALDQFTGFMTNPGDPTKYLEGIQKVADTYWKSHQ